MILAAGLGVVAVIAAGLAWQQRQEARRNLAKFAASQAALEDARQSARALLEHQDATFHVTLEQREASFREILATRDAEAKATLDAARADLEALVASRDALQTSLDRSRAQIAGLRRGLMEVGAERDGLAAALEEARKTQTASGAHEAELSAMRAQLETAESELARLRREAGRGASRAFFSRMSELERRAEDLTGEVTRLTARAEAAERELAQRAGDPADRAVLQERDALRAQVERLEEEARRLTRSRAALRVLGLPAPARDRALFGLERRATTESVLRDAYIAASAAAALIVDVRGATWGRCGNALVVERLAATATLLAGADVRAALGQPPQLVSELYGVYGRHLVALPDLGLWLGLTGSREVPALPLRLAALRLAGIPSEVAPAASSASLPLDPALSTRLDSWAARRGALAVAVFGSGEPAGTDSAFVGAAQPLAVTVQNLFNRALRDGFAQGFSVIWRAEDDECLCARVLDDGISVAFARFRAPPPARVLDDLAATLRWGSAPLAAAS